MITEDYCSYELSKLLKEKGFDGLVYTYYPRGVKDKYNISMLADNHNKHGEISRPTHQMAMKWLREEKGIYVYVEPYLLGGTYIDELEVHYCGQILDSNRRRLHSIENRTSYTEAIEERIKYALKSLI